MPIDELNIDIGFNSDEFKRGIEQATKDVDSFVRKTFGRRAGVVSRLSSGVGDVVGALGLERSPIGQFIARRLTTDPLVRNGMFMPSALARTGAMAGLGIGAAAIGGAGLAWHSAYQQSEARAAYVRQQADDSRRSWRPVSSLNYGAVTRQDVRDIGIQDERIARSQASLRRMAAPWQQNLRGAFAGFAQELGRAAEGRTNLGRWGPLGTITQGGLDAMRWGAQGLTYLSTGRFMLSREEQRLMDEQAAAQERRTEAIRQGNRSSIAWEIR